jgi:hypothetical protein
MANFLLISAVSSLSAWILAARADTPSTSRLWVCRSARRHTYYYIMQGVTDINCHIPMSPHNPLILIIESLFMESMMDFYEQCPELLLAANKA